MSRPVHLTGRLVCRDAAQAEAVRRHLPRHVELTRAEPGCVSFVVEPDDDGLVWHVREEFTDADAFRSHQERVAASAWGAVTADIERQYTVQGLDQE